MPAIEAKAPEQSHPLYPADGEYAAKPKANWRCKECHGWDYKGRDGAYAKGSHYTGIKGIRQWAGGDDDPTSIEQAEPFAPRGRGPRRDAGLD